MRLQRDREKPGLKGKWPPLCPFSAFWRPENVINQGHDTICSRVSGVNRASVGQRDLEKAKQLPGT
jgi:hypothetical protein